eukprot:TRINITY_DN1687_c0_g1_i2.p1 TRINITY_DN1687_c0_g1~~TRINITY_DN1687_c0_g1_i2.p1  ORF type:complete len:796 (+),score=138.20 TRINITY_DN1687_c0_g1_i2:19-2406(+)
MRRRLTVIASVAIGVLMTLFASFSFHMALPSHNPHSIHISEEGLRDTDTDPSETPLPTPFRKRDAFRNWVSQVRSNTTHIVTHNYTVLPKKDRELTLLLKLVGNWVTDFKIISKSIINHYKDRPISTTIRCYSVGTELTKSNSKLLHSHTFVDIIESNQPIHTMLLESGLLYPNSYLIVVSLDFVFNFDAVLLLFSNQRPCTLTSSTISTDKHIISHGIDTAEGKSGTQVIFERLAGYPSTDIRCQIHYKGGFVDPRYFGVHSQFLIDNQHTVGKLAVSEAETTNEMTDMNNPHALKLDEDTLSLLALVVALNATISILPSTQQTTQVVKNDEQWDPFHSEGFGAGLPLWASNYYSSTTYIKANTKLNPSLHVVWDTFCVKCFGFTNEVMHFISPLEKLVHIHSKQGGGCFCPGTPSSFEQSLTRINKHKQFATEFQQRSVWEKTNNTLIWVSHKDPGSFSRVDFGGRPDYIVGRSMYEFTKLDPKWIPKANDPELVDEIWVPSQYVYVVFKNNGINENRLAVIPEPIDTHLYSKRNTPKLTLPQRQLRWKTASTVSNPEGRSLSTTYKFFSVFKLEPRKGWELLVRSFVQEFTREGMNNNVSLYLVCYIWGIPDSRNPNTILNKIKNEIKDMGINPDDNNIPHIEVIAEELSERDLVRMYASVDAFVLPSRGEGWGLPIIQAMSMGLPAIATNWSGNVDFMHPEASLLLSVESFSPVPEESGYGSASGKLWANPSQSHLRQLMRQLVDDPAAGRRIGDRARQYIVENYSDEVTAQIVTERLKIIQQKVLSKRFG